MSVLLPWPLSSVPGALVGRRVEARGAVLVDVDAGAGADRVAGPAPGPRLLAPRLLTHLVMSLLQGRQAERARLLARVADLQNVHQKRVVGGYEIISASKYTWIIQGGLSYHHGTVLELI